MSVSPEYARAPPRVVLRPTAAGVLEVRDEDDDRQRLIIPREEEDYHYADCCKTPTMKEFRLPEVAASCPPAPRSGPGRDCVLPVSWSSN
ncbi:uncharacterized protein A4U43_C10F15530 [Asparagus officinalis]|uniref:Uncharacterized protein n=1 Tax=Asparagus officinalis TaxID=4686 RepID=A0A5P1E2Y5_ASPOF|nr:uncharacterized protein A4U43_C10F15530 [Asparagus officinalis]